MSESKIVRQKGYSFGKALEKSKQSREYWQERCELVEAELNEQVLCNAKGSEREAALLGKVGRLERELAEANTVLGAWHNVFGTTQLSHAQARLEVAENTEQLLVAELSALKAKIKNGELVPLEFLREHYEKYCGESEATHHVKIMQKLAADRAKEQDENLRNP